MKVTIERGEKFTVEFSKKKSIELTWEEWMEFRRMQNLLIYTKPES